MPLEGHYERQTTPLYKLSSRELKAAGAALILTVVAMLAVVLFTVGDSAPPLAEGCFKAQVAGIVGSETVGGCGVEAQEKCAHAAKFDSPRANTVVAECKARGIRF